MTDAKDTKKGLPFVIGAGLGRTGTHSLKAALMNLGYPKVFHMKEILEGRVPPEPWYDLAVTERQQKSKHPELALQTARTVIDQGYTATTDYPACLLYLEFLQLEPNAKVILSIRSSSTSSKSPRDWKESVLKTIGRIHVPLSKPPFSWTLFFRGFVQNLAPWIWERSGFAPLGSLALPQDSLEDQDLEGGYTAWIETVRNTVPSDKLLIHCAADDGYTPICKFLNITESDCPKDERYPHLGETAELTRIIGIFEAINLILWPVVVLSLAFVVWMGKKLLANKGLRKDLVKKKKS